MTALASRLFFHVSPQAIKTFNAARFGRACVHNPNLHFCVAWVNCLLLSSVIRGRVRPLCYGRFHRGTTDYE